MAMGQLQAFLDDSFILDPLQCSFHHGHGMQMVLAALRDDLWRHLDQSGSMLLLLLDLTVVLDMADHDVLTHCLADMGINGTALQ